MLDFGRILKAVGLGAGLLCGGLHGQAYAFLPQDELTQREFQANKAAMLLRYGDLEGGETVWNGCLPWVAAAAPLAKPGVLDITANPVGRGN